MFYIKINLTIFIYKIYEIYEDNCEKSWEKI